MYDATVSVGFACADLTTFCRLDELGLVATGQRLEPDRAVLVCRVVEPDQWCRRCGCEGTARDTVTRRPAHEPFAAAYRFTSALPVQLLKSLLPAILPMLEQGACSRSEN